MNLEKDTAPTGFYDALPRMGTIRRKGYTAKRRGKTVRVRPGLIRDVGAKGKWQKVHKMPGIGALKQGDLKAVGYDVTGSASRRHAAVNRAIKKYGRASTIRKLNAVAVYTRRTSPAKSRTFKKDMTYAQKK